MGVAQRACRSQLDCSTVWYEAFYIVLVTVGDGGKWLCGVGFLLQRPTCLVYSLGSGGDTSFESDILSKTSCEVCMVLFAKVTLNL